MGTYRRRAPAEPSTSNPLRALPRYRCAMRRHKRYPNLLNSSDFVKEATEFFGAVQRAKTDLTCNSEHYRILSDLDDHVAAVIRQITGKEVPWMRAHSTSDISGAHSKDTA